jgi:hypothetical protein
VYVRGGLCAARRKGTNRTSHPIIKFMRKIVQKSAVHVIYFIFDFAQFGVWLQDDDNYMDVGLNQKE